jgi:GNAT superfamily N-acetyltransferase
MKIVHATVEDAPRISALICQLSKTFLVHPSGEGAEPFLESINEPAIQGYISARNFEYFVAESHGTLAGVVALRDNSHLFHLFVAQALQARGIGGELWKMVKLRAIELGNPGNFTVNSSLNAVAVYQKFGFVASGPIVQTHGVTFQPMQLSGASNAV